MRCDGSELSVLYGVSMQKHEAPLRTHLPECELRLAVLHEGSYRYNGLITGSILSQKIADLFTSSNLRDTYIACIAMPVSPQEIQEKLEENRDMIAYFSTYKTFQRAYGNASRRIEEVPVPGVVQAIALLKEENDYLEHHMGGGFARTVVKFGANTAEDRSRLASLIRSCMECDRDLQSPAEPPRTFALHNPCDIWNDCLKVPSVQFGEAPESEWVYLLTLQDIPSIASFCLPPARSRDGFYVKDYTVDEDAMDAFPVTNPVHTVYQTVGTRSSSWFHSDETGENYNFTTKGRGLNEGLTTLYTNQQLTELSKEKGEAAERQQIYAHATELCSQLEDIVGQDTLKEAYYGGNLQALQEKVDALAGEKGYEALQDCLDRTLSKDPAERVEAMKEAQNILAKMYEKGETKA